MRPVTVNERDVRVAGRASPDRGSDAHHWSSSSSSSSFSLSFSSLQSSHALLANITRREGATSVDEGRTRVERCSCGKRDGDLRVKSELLRP